MATQQAGLFTQGPSVEDLLQQRNTRATNLQQQLMAQNLHHKFNNSEKFVTTN